MTDQAATTPPVQPASTTSAANPSATASETDSSTVNSLTTISSLADLKNKAPQLYNFMMLSLAQNICISMQQAQDRLSQAMKQMGGDNPGSLG